jgi:hypothetical protein
MSLAAYYGALTLVDRARDLMEQSLALDSQTPSLLFDAGILCESEFHDRERALKLLGDAIDRGYQIRELERAPSLVNLRRDPRFEQLRSRHSNASKQGG